MVKARTLLLAFAFLGLLFNVSCQTEECSDCGPGITQGYLFKLVTEKDLATLGEIEGIEVDVCITYSFVDVVTEEIDTETVKIVDDCCCD